MENDSRAHSLITIARKMGAGGAQVGRALAGRLGWRYLDRELLTEAAARLKQEPDDLDARDECHLGFWEKRAVKYSLGLSGAIYGMQPFNAIDDAELFSIQQQIIKETAAQGPVVIVGRAAHWILKDEPGLFSIYLHAPLEKRVRRVQRLFSLPSAAEAKRLVQDCDRRREEFTRWATGRGSEEATAYHLCADTSRFGIPGTVELILAEAARLERDPGRKKEEL